MDSAGARQTSSKGLYTAPYCLLSLVMSDPPTTSPSLCPECGVFRSALGEARQQIAGLRAEVHELRAHLNRNSSNSSTPPSANPPGAPKPVVRSPTGRKPGGPPGHRGHRRRRLPPESRERQDPAILLRDPARAAIRSTPRVPLRPLALGPGRPRSSAATADRLSRSKIWATGPAGRRDGRGMSDWARRTHAKGSGYQSTFTGTLTASLNVRRIAKPRVDARGDGVDASQGNPSGSPSDPGRPGHQMR